jgi:hypothetical protein
MGMNQRVIHPPDMKITSPLRGAEGDFFNRIAF